MINPASVTRKSREIPRPLAISPRRLAPPCSQMILGAVSKLNCDMMNPFKKVLLCSAERNHATFDSVNQINQAGAVGVI